MTYQKFSKINKFLCDYQSLSREGLKLPQKIDFLIREVLKNPRFGIGHPERLLGFADREVWSRRINKKHRLIYEIKSDRIIFIACLGHYDDH